MKNKLKENLFRIDEKFIKDAAFMEDIDINHQSLYMQKSKDQSEKNYGDPFNQYELNSFGYRSQEFKQVPLITAGCSVTFGVGLPNEMVWPSLVSSKLNLDFVNLSIPGWSAQAIVDNLFKYFYKYGNPKTLIVMFPDFFRLTYVSDINYAVLPNHLDGESMVKISDCQLLDTSVDGRPKYSKAPHKILDFIVPEYGILLTFKAINSLISYCKSANIKFVWTTWDFKLDNLIRFASGKINKSSYTGYVSSMIDMSKITNCHLKYEKIYKNNFYRGYDNYYDEKKLSHPGIHFHLHTAEKIIKKLESIR